MKEVDTKGIVFYLLLRKSKVTANELMEVFNGLKYTHIKEDIVNFRYLPIDLCLLPEEAEKVYGKDGLRTVKLFM